MLLVLVTIFNYILILRINADVYNISRKRMLNTDMISKDNETKNEWLFKDYMKKFDVMTVCDSYEQKYKKNGRKFTLRNELDNIMDKIDETDELLSLRIGKGEPKMALGKSGRRAAPGFLEFGVFRPTEEMEMEPKETLWDPHYVRYRLNELMKQLIYETRNKLVGMQLVREEYRKTSLYKMGFLMSKIDECVKNYIRFAFRTYKACVFRVAGNSPRHQLMDILATQERLLFKWFNIDLLTDLLVLNDDNARAMMTNVTVERKIRWKFVD